MWYDADLELFNSPIENGFNNYPVIPSKDTISIFVLNENMQYMLVPIRDTKDHAVMCQATQTKPSQTLIKFRAEKQGTVVKYDSVLAGCGHAVAVASKIACAFK